MNLKITIEECKNGFVITKRSFDDEIGEEIHVANEASQVRDIIYNLLSKG